MKNSKTFVLTGFVVIVAGIVAWTNRPCDDLRTQLGFLDAFHPVSVVPVLKNPEILGSTQATSEEWTYTFDGDPSVIRASLAKHGFGRSLPSTFTLARAGSDTEVGPEYAVGLEYAWPPRGKRARVTCQIAKIRHGFFENAAAWFRGLWHST